MEMEGDLQVPTLPADIVSNILSRLSVKTLCKFKSVSKHWLSIITDPFFISTHRIKSSNNPNLLLIRRNETIVLKDWGKAHVEKTLIEVLSLGFDGKRNSHFEITVSEAIELLPSKWELIFFVGYQNGFYVCNPSTRELVKLPEASWCTSGDLNAGIGYVEDRNQYVLAHLFDRNMGFSGDNDMGCEIIRFRDGSRVGDCSWKVTNANCPYMVRGWGVLVENAFYWLIWDAYDHPGNEAIISFDLEKEEFGTISPPKGCFDPNGVWLLVELKGSLCLVDSESKPSTMEIWVLKDCDKHVWVKQYSIDLDSFDSDLLKFITPLDQRDGEILMNSKKDRIDCYNLENKSFKRMENLVSGDWEWLRIYTESFFSFRTR